MPNQIEDYRRILVRTVKRHAQFQPTNGEIKTHAVCDRETDDYMVVDSGWNEKGRRIYDVVLHFRLQDGIVRVEREEIRFELSFGRMDLKTAIKQAEIVIAGISIDERLQEDIRTAMPVLEQRNSEFNRIYEKIMALSKEIPKEVSEITKEQEGKAKEILLPCLDEINILLKKNEEGERLKRKFRIHISMVERESPEMVKSAKDFLKRIEDSETEMENKAEAMLNEFLPMIERLKAEKKQTDDRV